MSTHKSQNQVEKKSGNLNPLRSIPELASEISRLDPGPAAALRRGPLAGAGAVAFWQIVTTHEIDDQRNQEGWAALLQSIAILTPKGKNPEKKSAYDHQVSMGAVLYRSGISDIRLARLLGAPKRMRRGLSVSLCRRLSRSEHTRFDLKTLARLILFDNDKTAHKIARDYYREEANINRASTNSSD